MSSGLQFPGVNYTLTFNATGVFPYLCVLHPSMAAVVTVIDSTGDVDAPYASVPFTPAQVESLAEQQISADATYAVGQFITDAALTGSGPQFTVNADGSKTWKVKDGSSAGVPAPVSAPLLQFMPPTYRSIAPTYWRQQRHSSVIDHNGVLYLIWGDDGYGTYYHNVEHSQSHGW